MLVSVDGFFEFVNAISWHISGDIFTVLPTLDVVIGTFRSLADFAKLAGEHMLDF